MNITRLNTLNDDKVIVKKEGGNGGGGTTGVSEVEYWELIDESEIPRDLPYDLHDIWQEITVGLYLMSAVTKMIADGEVKFMNAGYISRENYKPSKILAVCIIPSTLLSTSIFGLVSMKEELDKYYAALVEMVGLDWSFVIKRKLTKEEFYNLNA